MKILGKLGAGFVCSSKSEYLSGNQFSDSIILNYPLKELCDNIKEKNLLKFKSENDLELIIKNNLNNKLILEINSQSDLVNEIYPILNKSKNLNLNLIGINFNFYEFSIIKEIFNYSYSIGLKLNLINLSEFLITEKILNELKDLNSNLKIIIEQGKFFVESSYTLACKIIDKKFIKSTSNENDKEIPIYVISSGLFSTFQDVILCCQDLKKPKFVNESCIKLTEIENDGNESSVVSSSSSSSTLNINYEHTENCPLRNLDIGEWLLFENMGAYQTMELPEIFHFISEKNLEVFIKIFLFIFN